MTLKTLESSSLLLVNPNTNSVEYKHCPRWSEFYLLLGKSICLVQGSARTLWALIAHDGRDGGLIDCLAMAMLGYL